VIPCDVSRRDDVKRLAAAALDRMGRVDILINNAGTTKPQPIDAITDETWDEVLEINLSSIMALTRALRADEGASLGPHRPHFVGHGLRLEGEAQHLLGDEVALINFARASAIDLGPFGVTVNCIAPGRS
jgi:NAD(P)-dependent dehydrogenase (short-subunit alcohol dehydrogenase family)